MLLWRVETSGIVPAVVRNVEHPVEGQLVRLGPLRIGALLEKVCPSDDFLHRPVTHLGKEMPDRSGEEAEICHDILRLALEPLSQLRILGCNAGRTDIPVAVPAHDAALRNHHGCTETIFLRAEKCHENHIPGALETAVHLKPDLSAEIVHNQCLLNLCKTGLRRSARMLDASCRASSCASVTSAYENDIRLGLCHTGRNRAHTGL